MSISYSFYLATDRSADAVRSLLGVRDAGALPDAYGHGRPAYVLVKPVAPDPVQDGLFAAAFGFRPTVAVTVELAKDAETERWREGPALAILGRLADRLTADLYVTYLGDYPVFVRHRGEATFDTHWMEQRPWARDAFAFPYRVAVVADPYAEPV